MLYREIGLGQNSDQSLNCVVDGLQKTMCLLQKRHKINCVFVITAISKTKETKESQKTKGRPAYAWGEIGKWSCVR